VRSGGLLVARGESGLESFEGTLELPPHANYLQQAAFVRAHQPHFELRSQSSLERVRVLVEVGSAARKLSGEDVVAAEEDIGSTHALYPSYFRNLG